MPTLQEILTDIDTRVPNAFTVAQKVYWINEILLKIFPYTNIPIKLYTCATLNGSVYSLPTDCELTSIVTVERSSDLVVTDTTTWISYDYKGLLEELTYYSYFDALESKIGLYPDPASGYTLNLKYYPTATLLSASVLTAVPCIDKAWHTMLTLYTCMTVSQSGSNPDNITANNYMTQFNDMWKMMLKDWMDKKVKKPIKSRHARWW